MSPDSLAVEMRWRAGPLTLSCATCAAVAIVVAAVAGRFDLVVFAAPLLGVLAAGRWQRDLPVVRVGAVPTLQRCFEDDDVEVVVTAAADDASHVSVAVSTPAPMECEQDGQTWSVRAPRWGRYPVRVEVGVTTHGGLLRGRGGVDAAEVFVFPVAPAQSTPIPRSELLDRLGTHLTRHVGPGVEYADIRPYVPGDQLRTVNWPVSARRGALHVTERLTDRAADVVVLYDVYPQPPGPAAEATERAARGAAQVVQSALRYGDRAGLVALGARQIRWLGAEIGQRQFYRILDTMLGSAERDTMLGAADSFETATGTLAPRPAVPVGAIVVAFSTMLDTEFALALIDLRRRGHTVIAVDILQGCPIVDVTDPLVERMWNLQRAFMYRDMATVGVDIVAWPDTVSLDQAMALMPERRSVRR